MTTLLLWLATLWHGADLAALRSPDWHVRDAAFNRLGEAGLSGEVAAFARLTSTDAEVRWRCERVARRLTRYRDAVPLDVAAFALFTHPDEWCSESHARPWANRAGKLYLSGAARRFGLLGVHPDDGMLPWEPPIETTWDDVEQVQAVVNVIRHRVKGTPLPYPGDPLGPRK